MRRSNGSQNEREFDKLAFHALDGVKTRRDKIGEEEEQ